MRILFMGTGAFAVPSLKALLSSDHEVVGVVTQPDRPSGRGRQLRVSPVKEVTLEIGLPIYQPEKVRSEDFIEQVRRIEPDAIVVASFGQIIPKAILDIPRFGAVNVHSSLLPKYRGAAPIHYALFNGDRITGVTTMLMDPGLDTGPILLQSQVDILPDDDEGTLEARLAEVGADLLMKTLDGLEHGLIVPKPQDNSKATLAPSVKREECEIRWVDAATAVCGRVRGCSPRPGAYTFWQGSPLKVWWCAPAEIDAPGEPGEVIHVSPEGIAVQTGAGPVLITEVQPENKKRMRADEFARGYRVAQGHRFG
jgi:methionyl-tRNA formyltransferase